MRTWAGKVSGAYPSTSWIEDPGTLLDSNSPRVSPACRRVPRLPELPMGHRWRHDPGHVLATPTITGRCPISDADGLLVERNVSGIRAMTSKLSTHPVLTVPLTPRAARASS